MTLLYLLSFPLVVASVSALCDVCYVRNAHTKDYSTPFEGPLEGFPVCKQYQDASCCSRDTVQAIANGYALYDAVGETDYEVSPCDADPAVPRNMSKPCRDFFVAEFCFYECDVNTGKYRHHPNCDGDEEGWGILGMPINKSYCDSWYQACKDDYFCFNSETGDRTFYAHPPLNARGRCTLASGNCKTFADIFGPEATNGTGGGVGMCETLWASAFTYDTSNSGYVMSFETGQPNPNDAVSLDVIPPEACPGHDVTASSARDACGQVAGFNDTDPVECEICHLRNEHTADIASPKSDLEGPCAKYANNACCTSETANKVRTSSLYGEEYAWQRCYTYHANLTTLDAGDAGGKVTSYAECARWLALEECFYECDVNAGKWRESPTCSADADEWRMVNAPLRASECDAMYAACADVHFCVCVGDDCPDGAVEKSLFGLAGQPPAFCRDNYQYCSKPAREVWKTPQEFCELLWENSFVYEPVPLHGYSFAWNTDLDPHQIAHASNPNNLVEILRPFPQQCESYADIELAQCNATSEVAAAGGVALSPSDAPEQLTVGVLLASAVMAIIVFV